MDIQVELLKHELNQAGHRLIASAYPIPFFLNLAQCLEI